jgi:Permuted papain-like amidase enzyme, YaeF/YiiX, C92 family
LLASKANKGLTVNTELSIHTNSSHESSTDQVDLSDPQNLYKLLRIIKAEFPALITGWLGMTMDEFLKHPMAKFLIHAMTSKDVKSGFFVGHVAMVIRESEGQLVDTQQGVPYVIECNITDFSHYRVSIHRYHVDDGSPEENMARGWSNYRCGLGEKVWHAKPKYLFDAATTPADKKGARQLIANAAKALIGCPYGFFDNPKFGDSDRMYCSEFVFNAYKAAMESARMPDDKKTWGWVKTFFEYKSPEVGKLVQEIIDDKSLSINPDTPFFLLTPPMLWQSMNMTQILSPGNEPYA